MTKSEFLAKNLEYHRNLIFKLCKYHKKSIHPMGTAYSRLNSLIFDLSFGIPALDRWNFWPPRLPGSPAPR